MQEGVRIVVDKELCMSSGRCVADVPEVFRFDDDELAEVVAGPAAVSLDRLRAAVRGCPSQAITLEGVGQI